MKIVIIPHHEVDLETSHILTSYFYWISEYMDEMKELWLAAEARICSDLRNVLKFKKLNAYLAIPRVAAFLKIAEELV